MDVDIKSVSKIYFIGVGGIGTSALARMMLLLGKEVYGSDLRASSITNELKKKGLHFFATQEADNLPQDIDLVVYTIAIPDDSPELVRAQKLDIPTITYPRMLGLVSKGMYTIAVSGTHGKTTTTAMIADSMIDAKYDPTVIVGSLLRRKEEGMDGSNFIFGKSKYFLVEACEYRRSFLTLSPSILVITNIEADHLDYYKDLNDIQSAFHEMIMKLEEEDYLICEPHNPTVASLLKDARCIIVDYSTYMDKKIELKIPGFHNKKNAAIALAVADILDIKESQAIQSLNQFEGTWRRFEYKGKTEEGILIYDDYAHHPTEIKATLQAFRERYPTHTLIVVFQPHLYSRTKDLMDEFSESFKDASHTLVLPIYAAREKEDTTISSQVLVQNICNTKSPATFVSNALDVAAFLKESISDPENTVLVTMGAGDVYSIGEALYTLKNNSK